VRRYTAELARALAAQYPEDTYHLLSDQPFEFSSDARNLLNGEHPQTWFARRWWSVGLPRELQRLKVDVFHGTDFAVPYVPLRASVMTLHDLSPWRDEVKKNTSVRVRRRAPILIKSGVATMIITPSEAVRREAIERFGVAADRVVAVPLAASERFRPVEPVRRERPYFLYVGSLTARKNVATIERAWQPLRRDADLWIPARDGWVDDALLPAAYSGALAVLYPSLYEGFGLPVLEAMQCGAMVIASRDPAITELVNTAAAQVEPLDVDGWTEAMRGAFVAGRRAAWRERALNRAAAYSWQRTAARTREVYDEALRRF
jgi:alpha-1,3-rhamnosyl/mannosyltransferase